MYASKSFCNVGALVSNVPGVNSTAGEITQDAMTYSRELGTYQVSERTGYTLHTLTSADETETAVAMPYALALQIINATHFLVNKAFTETGEIFHDELLADFIEYGDANDFTTASLGPVVKHVINGADRWLPNWLKFKSELGVEVDVDNENTIWLSIASLALEYDDYEIVPVKPIPNLDSFFLSGANVEALIDALTFSQTIDDIHTVRGAHPETVLRSDAYDYINPLDQTHRVSVNWPVLIYGPAGNNTDAIKDNLIDFILANSTHDRNAWTAIFPDIFKRTEFMVIPQWNRYAIPSMTLQNGIFSPVANLKESYAYLKQVVSDYDEDHVDEYATVFGHQHRSLSVACVGSAENRDDLFQIDDVFTDYINVASSSVDFNRMAPATQAWVTMITTMIVLAETMSQYTTMPQGMMRITRAGVLYVVKTYNNIQYLVAAKSSVFTLLGLDEDGNPI